MPNSNDMNNPVETNENELTGQYSPVSSFTQRVDILSKENKLEYPKYRTLSEEQTRTYIKATELPDIQRKSMALDLAKAKENTAAQNAKNAVVVEMASMMSGVGTEAALGNILVTDDYSPVVGSAAEAYAGGKIAQAVGGGALKQAGAFALGTAAMGGLLTALSPTELGGEDTPQEIFDSFYRPKIESLEKDWKSGKISYDEYTQQTKDLNNQFETTVKSRFPNTNFQEQIEQSLKSQGYTDEQIERLKQPTKVQSLGLRLTQSAMDRLEYRTSVMPQVDADSVAARFATAPMSAGEYLMTGVGVAKLARTAIKASKMPKDRWGRKSYEFTAKKGTKYEDVVDRYAGMVGNKIGSGAATAQMSSDIMGQGALESIQKYIEDTGDTELTNYTGDIRKAALDAFSTHTQNVVEKMGFNKFIKNPRAVKKWGEWGNGFVQEFTQGEINDVSEFVKGNQSAMDVINNIPYNVIDGVAGSWTQGTIGTAYFNYYHNKNVNDLVNVIMAQKPNKTEQEVRQFAENKVKDIENEVSVDVVKEIVDFTDATQYQGKIYENIRDNVKKAIDYQMDIMKDTDEGSEFENLTEDELAQYVEQVAHDETDKVVIESLENGTPLSESPRLKGITIAGTYYLEGEDYAQETKRKAEETRQALLNAVYAEREAQRAQRLADQMAEGAERARERRIRAESAQQTKEAEQRVKLDEKSAKEIAKQVEKSLKEQVKSTNNIKIATTKAIKSGNVETIGKVLSDNGFAVRNMSGTQIKLLAKLNWQLFKGMDLGESMRSSDKRVALSAIEKNVESGNAVLTRAGYTKEQIDSMDDETWNRAVLTQYRKENQEQEPELTEEQMAAIPDDLQFQDLADENESLDAIYPEYTGETIEVDGKERTVYNSNGDRIAKSKEALTNFWRWFGDSKVVDSQGRPLVVYHGTKAQFEEFAGEKIGQSGTSEGVGFYFTNDRNIAAGYGDVMSVYLKLEHPVYAYAQVFLAEDYDGDLDIMEANAEMIRDASMQVLEDLKAKGYEFYDETTSQMADIYTETDYDSLVNTIEMYIKDGIKAEEYDENKLYNDIREAIIKEFGFDGFKTKRYNNSDAAVYVALMSNQIKSVDNRGTYSSDTGNIYYQTQKQSRKGGAYDPRTRSITLGSGANVTTFPHEFAHYWIEKNFKWARSGKASQEWMRQWSAVEKWLGIDPDDKYLDKAASEKFARAYERFLGEEQVPLVLKKSLGDFRDFVLDHYDFELDEAKGLTDKFGRPIKLNDDVKNWFKKSIYETYSNPVESEVVVERLRKDAEDNKEIKQADQENETIRENVKNSESFKTADAETNLMEVQESAGISNEQIIGRREIGGGEQKESKGKIAEQLGGRTYESTSWEIQEQMVEDYLKTVSLDQALEDLDNETYPEKIDPNFLRSALTEKLLDAGREMEATALIEETADDFSDAAQRLQAARTLNTPFTNAIQTLNIAKAEQLARAKFGNKKTAVADLDAAMNRLVAKYEKDFLNAETDEEREMVYAALQDEAVRTIGSLNKDESSKLDFQTIEDKEERKQAREIRKQQKRRASIKAYRGKAKRALKQALGLEPTRQQVREIRKRAVKVQKAIADFRKDVRQNKTSAIDPIKVLEAQNELNNYMNSQLPTRYLGTFADAANSYMMANMLWNPATNVFNLESTWVQMIPHLTALAINNGTFGTISAREKAKIIKSAIITQIKTGYNIFSLRDFFDNKTIWAEKFYEAQSVLGKGIRVPLTALGLMDTMNKGIVFLQAVDSMATKQAREEGKKNGWTAEQVKQRAKELFYQALNTDPRTITIDGLKIRKAAVQEGEEATFTQNTRTAQIVNKVRKALNFGGKTGLGNVIMPFTTTIANIAEDTVVNYSLGIVKNTPKAVKAIATTFDKTATAEMKKEAWKEVLPETKNAIKNVIGILILLSFALGGDDDDYVLGYDRQTAKDKDIRTNRNAPYGYAVRLGDKWVDLDLFGIGSQYAKMYMIARRGNFEPDAWTNAIVSSVDLLPGVGELQSMYDTFTNMSKMKGEWEGVAELASDKIEELSVRLIPVSALLGQIASIADTSKRETWNNWYDKMKAKIPVLRETLPERTSTQTGEVIPQTDTVFNLATGSRIKDYIEPTGADEVRYEFADSGKPLSYREGNSKLKELGKDTVAYKKAVNRVRKDFTKKLENISDNPEYQRLDIDQKRKVVNELHKEALTDVKVDLGLEKPKKASKKRLKKQGKNDNLK